MKQFAILALILLLLSIYILVFGQYHAWQVRAPELFGDGQLYLLRLSNGHNFGVVQAWGWWLFYGQGRDNVIDCSLVQVRRMVVDATGVIDCKVKFQGRKFLGWIDFRGHERPFCGMDRGEFPGQCKLRDGAE